MKLQDYIDNLRSRAKSLRNDWLVSMAEGMCNQHIADILEEIANDLEGMLNDAEV